VIARSHFSLFVVPCPVVKRLRAFVILTSIFSLYANACSSPDDLLPGLGATGGDAQGTGATTSSGGAGSGGAPLSSGGANTGSTTSSGGSGGAAPSSGGADVGTGGGSLGSGGGATGPTAGACTIGAGIHTEEGSTLAQYQDEDVQRDAKNYMMITNGWGQGWLSHDIAWLGTTLTVKAFEGSRQSNGAPAGYPTVFCGRYSDKRSLECGLPKTRSSVTALNTAASWSHTEANGTYNVAYDIWMGDSGGTGFGGGLQSYFMVWLHDPATEGPAGSLQTEGVTVANVPGVWNIVAGTVNGLPIVNYVRAEGDDATAIAFDIMGFVRDAEERNLNFPGNDILSVAIGFEIWQGPVTSLKLDDFCVDVQ